MSLSTSTLDLVAVRLMCVVIDVEGIFDGVEWYFRNLIINAMNVED